MPVAVFELSVLICSVASPLTSTPAFTGMKNEEQGTKNAPATSNLRKLMTHSTDNEIRVELKYCERCGELWFRLVNSHAAICGPCTKESPYAFLRHRERTADGNKERISSARVTANTWYGPMTGVVKRLQGVATAGGAA